ncbi:MAG: hypothetical protein GDA56_14970 [Hormoscilla sp. GM7CHS1pb]|nr:hypothetical protein [Hormoscilla sp. GM7CHS1pb]
MSNRPIALASSAVIPTPLSKLIAQRGAAIEVLKGLGIAQGVELMQSGYGLGQGLFQLIFLGLGDAPRHCPCSIFFKIFLARSQNYGLP